jgi:hypothetical protein
LKLWLRIRHAALRIHVIEIEFNRQKSTVGEFFMKVIQEWRIHTLTGAVRKDDCGVTIPGGRSSDG